MNCKKWLVCLMALLMVVFAAIPAAAAKKKTEEADQNQRVVSLSDIHILPGELMTDPELCRKNFRTDIKDNWHNEAIISSTLQKVKELKPEVLLVSGDLTKNGEKLGHAELSRWLEALQKSVPGMHGYVINGNHDINAEGNTPVPGTARITPEEFRSYYKITYQDPTIIARYVPKNGAVAGQESYVARPKPGYTIIAMDDGRYSSDNTKSGKNIAEGGGQITPDLEKWILQQIEAAKQRGDKISGMQHQGEVAHYNLEGPNLVADHDRLSKEFADAGMHMIFTGHMHNQRVSHLKTEKGNDLYDVETCTPLTFPSVFRLLNLQPDGTVSWQTVQTDPKITDMLDKRCGTVEWLASNVNQALKLEDTKAGDVVTEIIDQLANSKIDDTHTFLDFGNYIAKNLFAGPDDGNAPQWVKQALSMVQDGSLLKRVILPESEWNTLFCKLQTPGAAALNAVLYKLVMGLDESGYAPMNQNYTAKI